MKTNKSKRQRDIKSKLMAAICMLLVSSIMMVSSTYAWFTLSTAPEVTGITTAVGANGNLEMALQPLDGDSSKISTAVGDGVAAINLRNTTWGNLVDVSDNSLYGLNNIKLYPSQLNLVEGKIASAPLATPAYGADGRITELEKKTITGVYNPEGKFLEGYNGSFGSQTIALNKAYGVRAVGTSSGMSDRQLAYRAALAAANTAAEKAASSASQSLNTNGAKLADIAIKHATWESKNGTEEYSASELKYLQAILNSLLGENPAAVDGSLEYIAEGLKQYAMAYALNEASDDEYANVKTAFEGATLDTLASVMQNNGAAALTEVSGVITTLQSTINKVNTAKATIDPLANGSRTDIAWGEFRDALFMLVDADNMQINQIPVSKLTENWTHDETKDGPLPDGYYADENGVVHYEDDDEIVSNMQRLVDAVLADGLQLIIASGAGVYADVADFCGDYNAAVTLAKVSYGGMTVKNLDANMATKSSVKPCYLAQAKTAIPAFSGSGAASAAISDYYGYIIDLAFRTNAAGSSLRLQQEAIDRIYSEGTTNEATMGHGASMTFSSDATGFTDNQVKSLMSSIRIVFFNTNDGAVLGYAKLDDTKASNPATGGIKMPLVMTDDKGVAKTGDDATIIMPLEQNTITELSVLVYLDGENVTNADVATGASSMSGSMNLQFSSTATLDPMDYTPLKEGTVTTPTTTNLTNVTVTGATKGNAVYSQGVIAIELTGVTEGSTATIKVGDGAATPVTITTKDGVTGIAYPATGVAENTAIVVTVTAPATGG